MIKSNLISLFIHIIIIFILIFFAKTNTISPASPNGIEIAIIEQNSISPNIEPNQNIKETDLIKSPEVQIKKQIKNKEIKKQKNELKVKKQIKKGHQNALSKEGDSESKNLITNYANLVADIIKPYVNIPPNIDKKSIAILEVTILPNMDVYDIKLIKSSGNESYDESIKSAILKVKTFPPIPPNTRWVDYRVLVLTFKPF